ncbi:MAG TPA: hypothetical protein VIC32_05560 [Terriglobales bacterium]|jgi:hypothetical protein
MRATRFWLATALLVSLAAGQKISNSNPATVNSVLANSTGSALDVNGTRLRVQTEAAGNGNTPQDLRADSWGDGASNGIQQLMAFAAAAGWNGSSFDRLRTTSADNSSKTGVLEANPVQTYAYIVTAATTAVKATAGVLHKIVINTPAAGTIGLYDVASGSCSGTPGSGKFAFITVTSSTQPVTLRYDVKTANGICVVTSAAMDITAVIE